MKEELHRKAMDLVADAEQLSRVKRYEAARETFEEAAMLEQSCADAAQEHQPRSRGILRVSAVSAWMQAGRLDRAEALAQRYLVEPLSPSFAREIHGLLNEIRDRRASEAIVPVEPDDRAEALLAHLRRLEQNILQGWVPRIPIKGAA